MDLRAGDALIEKKVGSIELNDSIRCDLRSAAPKAFGAAVPPTSKSAPLRCGQRVWKPATRQTWKSALR